MRKTPLTILLLALAPLLGACAAASATSKAGERPALVIPAPPPHVIDPGPEPAPEPVSDLPQPNSLTVAPAARPGRATPVKPPAEVKPEPPKTDPAPVEAPPVAPPPPTPAPQLRTAESSGVEATVRATIDRSRQLLATIDYRPLTKERRKAYDDAKRFAQQAEDALKGGNVVFAQGVASKAETLARELAGRL